MLKIYRIIFFYFIAGFLLSNSLPGQTSQTTQIVTPKPAVLAHGQPKFDQSLQIVDVNGRPFQNIPSDVTGSPYYIDGFRRAKITLTKGIVYENIDVKIDLFNEEVHLLDKNHKEIIAEDGIIREIQIFDTTNTQLVFSKFQTGFPFFDKNNSNTLYRVLSDGKIKLLLYSKKEISVIKDVMSGEVSKEFLQRDEYYVFQNGEIQKLKKEKDFILSLMNDQQQKISEYMSDKKFSLKKQDMLVSLFNYYNSFHDPTLLKAF
jgi:hypothetical protein